MASAMSLPWRRDPNTGAVDATASAVESDAGDEDVEILLPVIHLVVTDENLAVAGPVDLDAGVARVLVDRGLAAEQHRSVAGLEHGCADIACAGVDGEGLRRYARLDHGLGHAIGRPRLLRAGLEDEADLHRDDGHPKRMHAGRVAWQHHAEHVGLRLVAEQSACGVKAVTLREDVQIESASERVENAVHLAEHERDLVHVLAAHVLGQAGCGRLLADEIIRRLRTVAERQFYGHEEFTGLLDHRDQVAAGNLAQDAASGFCLAHVAPHHAGQGLAHLGRSAHRC